MNFIHNCKIIWFNCVFIYFKTYSFLLCYVLRYSHSQRVYNICFYRSYFFVKQDTSHISHKFLVNADSLLFLFNSVKVFTNLGNFMQIISRVLSATVLSSGSVNETHSPISPITCLDRCNIRISFHVLNIEKSVYDATYLVRLRPCTAVVHFLYVVILHESCFRDVYFTAVVR